ncbi:hypothetical protein NDU88_002263 [Pleurodeles waltl]|uniref:Uncharacterized protein n=1 Tax=Pleurodeles waltl TaxID=8319 RepID=A0AAV7LF72_PLEWA|nr:hypothetical protein NDU88_002263 [Pleurodeles waltl]
MEDGERDGQRSDRGEEKRTTARNGGASCYRNSDRGGRLGERRCGKAGQVLGRTWPIQDMNLDAYFLLTPKAVPSVHNVIY